MFIHFFCLCPLGLAIKLNFNMSKVAYWCSLISWFNSVTATCRTCLDTLRQGCLRLFCRCDTSHEFKPVWICATDRSDKILSQRQWFLLVTRGDLLHGNLSRRLVAAICRIMCLGLNLESRSVTDRNVKIWCGFLLLRCAYLKSRHEVTSAFKIGTKRLLLPSYLVRCLLGQEFNNISVQL